MEKNKILIPTIIAVITLILITFGATYAYFTVTANNEFGSKTIEATISDVGSVALSTGSNLYLNLSRIDMIPANVGTYYAVSDSEGIATTEPTTINIGTATVTGEGTFSCSYKLLINYEGNLKEALENENVAVLTVNETTYDVFDTEFPLTMNESITNLVDGFPQNITAQFKFVNTNSIQNELKNKHLKITFTVLDFNCTAI